MLICHPEFKYHYCWLMDGTVNHNEKVVGKYLIALPWVHNSSTVISVLPAGRL